MTCAHFGECGSCTLYHTPYQEQLEWKHTKLSLLLDIPKENIEVFDSPDEGFRRRAEFRVFHHGEEGISFAMSGLEQKIVPIEECNIVTPVIKRVLKELPLLLKGIAKDRLYSSEFLSSVSGECVVTLIYRKAIDDALIGELASIAKRLGLNIVCRSKGKKIVIGDERLVEEAAGFSTFLREGAFSQPNLYINQKMVSWVADNIESNGDILELYCGNGNFTFALSKKCGKLLATEVSKSAIKDAQDARGINGIDNIEFVRLDADELMSALRKEREFFRLKDIDLDSYRFCSLFVDPPRAGLSREVIEFAKNFSKIVYVSCNPHTLSENLGELKEFEIKHTALFDQFPHTEHIECGVVLSRY